MGWWSNRITSLLVILYDTNYKSNNHIVTAKKIAKESATTTLYIIEGSLEVKLPTTWRDEKQSRAEAERRGRLEERRSEEKE